MVSALKLGASVLLTMIMVAGCQKGSEQSASTAKNAGSDGSDGWDGSDGSDGWDDSDGSDGSDGWDDNDSDAPTDDWDQDDDVVADDDWDNPCATDSTYASGRSSALATLDALWASYGCQRFTEFFDLPEVVALDRAADTAGASCFAQGQSDAATVFSFAKTTECWQE